MRLMALQLASAVQLGLQALVQLQRCLAGFTKNLTEQDHKLKVVVHD